MHIILQYFWVKIKNWKFLFVHEYKRIRILGYQPVSRGTTMYKKIKPKIYE